MASTDETRIQFGITQNTLVRLMEQRGLHGMEEHGGIHGICKKLQTSINSGITGAKNDLDNRRQTFGENWIEAKLENSFLKLCWESMHDKTLIFLFIIHLISIICNFYEYKTKTWANDLAVMISIVVIILITALNDYFKEWQFFRLYNRIERGHLFNVIRNGKADNILASDIVVGDICQIRCGDKLPVDGIIIYSYDLQIDESTIFRCMTRVKKDKTSDAFVLAGTYVLDGRGKIVVTAVGANTQASKQSTNTKDATHMNSHTIASNYDKDDYHMYRSALQAKLMNLAYYMNLVGGVLALSATIILVTHFYIRTFLIDREFWHLWHVVSLISFVVTGVGMLLIACPDSLPLAITLSLAYSVKKILKDHNLVRHLVACETMAYVTTICTNKTGSLTVNEMSVVKSYVCGNLYSNTPKYNMLPLQVADKIIEGISINTEYTARNREKIDTNQNKHVGCSTDCAMLQFVEEMGDRSYKEIRKQFPEETFRHVLTFNPFRKSKSTIVPMPGGGYRLFCKGACEIVLTKCSFIYGVQGTLDELTHEKKTILYETIIKPMSCEGLRTIAVAYCDFVIGYSVPAMNEVHVQAEPDWEDEESVVSNMTILCMVGIEDPVRPEVPKAIKQCQKAGITVRMISGEDLHMARAIAIKCGIVQSHESSMVLDSNEFNNRIRDSDGNVQQHLLDKVWPNLRVLGRSTPDDKLTLVKGIIESKLLEYRDIVAVIGYSSNDGPVLKKADVGFALGSGTDVAKEASDIILTDDSFSGIVNAVMWGRNVYDSISKFIQFQLTVNIVAIFVAFSSICLVQDTPIKDFQMLYISLVMDTLASVALTTDKPTTKLLNHRPYLSVSNPLMSRVITRNIVGQSIYQITVIMVLLFFGHYLLDIEYGIGHSRSVHCTIIYNTFVLMTLFNELNVRKMHGKRNIFDDVLKNRIFLWIWIITWVTQLFIVQSDGIWNSNKGLTLDQWMWCLFFGVGTLLWGQLLISVPNRMLPKCFAIELDYPTTQTLMTVRNKARWRWHFQSKITPRRPYNYETRSKHITPAFVKAFY